MKELTLEQVKEVNGGGRAKKVVEWAKGTAAAEAITAGLSAALSGAKRKGCGGQMKRGKNKKKKSEN